MRNFKLTLEYEGTHFSGWQTQAPGLRTVQAHLEDNLQRIFKRPVHCQASGRTDSGVHAMAQVAHFKTETAMSPELIHTALNAFLDRDISVSRVEEVALDFHAQKDVVRKTYRYTILNRPYPSALWRDRAYYYPRPLNLAAMRRAASIIKGTHDFKSFQGAATVSRIKNTVRTVTRLSVAKEDDLIHITITSDGFLYKMVRNIVGVLLAAGAGRMPSSRVRQILKAKDRTAAPRTAPAYGLCLMAVEY